MRRSGRILVRNALVYLSSTRGEELYLETGLEGQLQLTAFDDNVWEVKQVHLQGIKHALAGDYDLLRLLLHR